MKIDNYIIQKRISLIISIVGLAVVLINIFRNVYFRDKELLSIILNDLSISFVFIVSLLIFFTRNIKSFVIRYLQIIVFMMTSTIAILDEYDSFNGIGFIILTFFLAYRYNFFKKNGILKVCILIVYTLFIMEYSIIVSEQNQIGSSFNMILYLVFFLMIIYTIYTTEINQTLLSEKKYHKSLLGLVDETKYLANEISTHKSVIQNKEIRLEELSKEIMELKSFFVPLNLSTDYNITPREDDVIREFCLNPHLTTKEIANNLHMSVGTVKTHFGNIFKKLEVRSRSDLLSKCRWSYENYSI